ADGAGADLVDVPVDQHDRAGDDNHDIHVDEQHEHREQAQEDARPLTRSSLVNCRRSIAIVSFSIAALSLPHRAAAQGNSQNHGRAARPPASAPAAPVPVQPAGTGVRNFGAWLDDTSIVDPHTGWAGFSLGYWKSPLGHQIDMPSRDRKSTR